MNPYLTKLRDLSKENVQVTEPSKPSKPCFDGFECDQSSRVSGNEPVEFEQGCYRNTLAALRAECPAYVDAADRQQAIEDAHRFVTQWGKQAEALGWTPADLFGLHISPEKPAPNYRRLSRFDQTGLIWLLHSRPVIALTETAATILATSGANLTYCRYIEPAPPLVVLRMSVAIEIANGTA